MFSFLWATTTGQMFLLNLVYFDPVYEASIWVRDKLSGEMGVCQFL